MMATHLIFIGDKFYFSSGTVMSPIYALDGSRYDWGFVQRDLKEGKTVIIRPATASEMVPYQERLDALERRRKEGEKDR